MVVNIGHAYLNTQRHMCTSHACSFVCVYINIYKCVCVRVCIYMCVCVCKYMYRKYIVCMRTRMCVCVQHASVCVRVRVRVCVYLVVVCGAEQYVVGGGVPLQQPHPAAVTLQLLPRHRQVPQHALRRDLPHLHLEHTHTHTHTHV